MTTAPIPIPAVPSLRWLRRLAFPAGVVLGILLAVTLAPNVAKVVADVRANLPELEVGAQASQTPTLPREWRWEQKTVEFDSMVRSGQRQSSPWIRGEVDRQRAKPSR